MNPKFRQLLVDLVMLARDDGFDDERGGKRTLLYFAIVTAPTAEEAVQNIIDTAPEGVFTEL